MIDLAIQNELRAELGNNEVLLWTGRPPVGIHFILSDLFLIPVSLLWFGFVIVWELIVLVKGAPFFFLMWGLPFLLMGFYISIGRFFVDSYKRRNTIYAITHDRILIKTGFFSRKVKSLNIKKLSNITFKIKKNGSGTIVFGRENGRYIRLQGADWPGRKQTPRFESIPDVKKAYDIIIENQRNK